MVSILAFQRGMTNDSKRTCKDLHQLRMAFSSCSSNLFPIEHHDITVRQSWKFQRCDCHTFIHRKKRIWKSSLQWLFFCSLLYWQFFHNIYYHPPHLVSLFFSIIFNEQVLIVQHSTSLSFKPAFVCSQEECISCWIALPCVQTNATA